MLRVFNEMESDISTQKVVIDICRNLSQTILYLNEKSFIDCRVGKFLMTILKLFFWGRVEKYLIVS